MYIVLFSNLPLAFTVIGATPVDTLSVTPTNAKDISR